MDITIEQLQRGLEDQLAHDIVVPARNFNYRALQQSCLMFVQGLELPIELKLPVHAVMASALHHALCDSLQGTVSKAKLMTCVDSALQTTQHKKGSFEDIMTRALLTRFYADHAYAARLLDQPAPTAA